ncbi:immediate early response gene 2 protein [Corvus hawaiiensis]|uniref:immediate early response gene 2 protein n=1 Tax=Corvus hawaiiensis TaxID=134902 RepID=UPI0020185BEB|nr:immediate early response gene 2 protein [Corvus hawaiiensis]
MEEAQRLLTVSVWKLYRCRLRRGGLRLHRSLQLSLLVRAARHRYLSARAAAETLPGPALPGDAACRATSDRGDLPRDPAGDPRNAWCPNRPSGDHPNRQTGDPGTDQKRGDPSENPTGDPRNAWCPNRPSADLPNRPTPRTEPRTDQKWGNPLRDWTGDPPNLPTGAPRSEWDRGCPPSRPTEDPPERPTRGQPGHTDRGPREPGRRPRDRCPRPSPVRRSPPGRAEAAQQRFCGAGAGAGTEQTGRGWRRRRRRCPRGRRGAARGRPQPPLASWSAPSGRAEPSGDPPRTRGTGSGTPRDTRNWNGDSPNWCGAPPMELNGHTRTLGAPGGALSPSPVTTALGGAPGWPCPPDPP